MRENSKFKKHFTYSKGFNKVSRLLRSANVHTICHSGRCPNINECFSQKKLTFLILGDTCTRNCAFCNVRKGKPGPVDPDEHQRIKNIIRKLQLEYIVITSVTRDDLPDQGCSVYCDTVLALKKEFPQLKIELLIPAFNRQELLERILDSGADVIGHNMEMVERLYPEIRPGADFQESLLILETLKKTAPRTLIKTGFMAGLGETIPEINGLLRAIRDRGVDIVTIGQYFQPSLNNYPVKKFYSDEEFDLIAEQARAEGFLHVYSGRFVRSSYFAENAFFQLNKKKS